MYAEKSVVYTGKERFTHVLWTQYTAFNIEWWPRNVIIIYIFIKVNALWESSVNFMFWKSSNFAEYRPMLFTCCHCWFAHVTHVTRVVIVITAINRDAVRHMLLLLQIIARSKSWIFLLIWNQYFCGSTRLLWIPVSLQKCSVIQTWMLLCFGYQPITFLYFPKHNRVCNYLYNTCTILLSTISKLENKAKYTRLDRPCVSTRDIQYFCPWWFSEDCCIIKICFT